MAIDYNALTHPGIQKLSPYVPGRGRQAVKALNLNQDVIKLASNENPLGCSPHALAALKALTPLELSTYPVSDDPDLRQAIATQHQVDSNMVILSNGSSALFQLILMCFALHRKKQLLTHKYAFIAYTLSAQALGIDYHQVPLNQHWQVDGTNFLKSINEKTGVIMLANPNNPTGSQVSNKTLIQILEQTPPETLFVLDGAYDEYLPLDEKNAPHALLAKFPNLIITRTFSKAYGLAGLRIGYALANPEIITILKKTMPPFSINQGALVAARAALSDEIFLKKSVAMNTAGLAQLQAGLQHLGFQTLLSAANFVPFHAQDHDESCFQYLLSQGIIIRPLGPMGMPNWLRVSVGTPAENKAFLNALNNYQTVKGKP